MLLLATLGLIVASTVAAPLGAAPRGAGPRLRDAALVRLRRALPAGWQMSISGPVLRIESRAWVWVQHGNRINAPMSRETPAERAARLKRGRKMHSALVLRLEKRWSATQLAQARRHNRRLRKRVAALIDKHGLSAIFRGNSKLPPAALAARRGLGPAYARYAAERRQLEKRLFRLPAYQSQRHSLWLQRIEGASDAFSEVYPERLSRQNHVIRSQLLRRLLQPVE